MYKTSPFSRPVYSGQIKEFTQADIFILKAIMGIRFGQITSEREFLNTASIGDMLLREDPFSEHCVLAECWPAYNILIKIKDAPGSIIDLVYFKKNSILK